MCLPPRLVPAELRPGALNYSEVRPLRVTPPRRMKCESCGSGEFKRHRGAMVCAFCRSPA